MNRILLSAVFLLTASCIRNLNTMDPAQSVHFIEPPKLSATYASSLEYSLKLNNAANVYYVTVPAGSPAPMADEIFSGKSSGGLKSLAYAFYRAGVQKSAGGAVLPGTNASYDVFFTAGPQMGMMGLFTSVYKISARASGAYVFKTKWGTSGSGDGQLSQPWGIYADPDGNVYVVDTWNSRIQKFDPAGNLLLKWGTPGTGDAQFQNLQGGICADPAGNIYVADMGNLRIKKFDAKGNHIKNCEPGHFILLCGICSDPHGNIYTTDITLDRVRKFDSNLNFIAGWGTNGTNDGEFDQPFGICSDPEGNIYVADEGNDRIQKFDSSGNYLMKWGAPGTGDGQLASPRALCVDAAGNFYVSDSGNFRVQKFDCNGNYITKWGLFGSGDGQFMQHYGISVDASGNVYVSDTGNDRVQVFR